MAFIESGAFAYGGVGTESPLRDTADSAFNKQNSDFSLNLADNLDECEFMNGISLESMNIDEFLSSLCDDEDTNQVPSKPNVQTHHQYITNNSQPIENQPVLAHQRSILAPDDIAKETVEEVVFDTENPVNNNTMNIDRAPSERQHSCGEIPFEDFVQKVRITRKAPQTHVPVLLPPPNPQQMATQPPPSQSNTGNPQQIMMPSAPVQSDIGNPQQMLTSSAPMQSNVGNPQEVMLPPAPMQSNVGNPQEVMMPPAPMQGNIGSPQQMMMPTAPMQSNVGSPQQMMMPSTTIQSNIGNPQQMIMPPATSIQPNINNSSANPVYGMENMNLNANINMNMNMGMHRNGMAMGYAGSQPMVVGSNSDMTYPIYSSPVTAVANNNVADSNVEMDNIVATEGSSTNYRKRLIDSPMGVTDEKKQRRMIKNRAAAARSRARKQVYTAELEYELQYLEQKNRKLKATMKILEAKGIQETIKRTQKTKAEKITEKWKKLRRTSSF